MVLTLTKLCWLVTGWSGWSGWSAVGLWMVVGLWLVVLQNCNFPNREFFFFVVGHVGHIGLVVLQN